ncbi:MAG TPA: M6 family metalloprotease domain-containing protein, partial [Bacteroidales bacterium]|nr:M6 family metalloprotease domain-containing protein [Bacteroidales bacterium]
MEIHVFISGDEYYLRLHDANNYTIIQHPATGYYMYAMLDGDSLVPTSLIVGISDATDGGLVPGIDIPAAKKLRLRSDFLQRTPSKPQTGPAEVLNSGSINNIVVFIRFSDQTEFPSSLSVYDDMFNNSAPSANSMYNYFKEASFNSLSITSTYYPTPSGTVIVSYQDSHPRSYYMPYNVVTNPGGYIGDVQRTTREHSLLADAVDFIDGMVPSGLDIDNDNDGYVDNVCFIIRGSNTSWSDLLWPHRWVLYTETATINGVQVWDYNFQLETFLTGSGNGVLCHEMFHSLGAPDLYHYTDNGIDPVGPWDIMETTSNPPQSMGAWMKYKYGTWIGTVPVISTSGTFTLNPVTNSTNNLYRLNSPNSTTEFFILEYRRQTGTFESSIPGSGLLIYRINTLAGDGNAEGPPDEVYLYRVNGTTSSNGNLNQAHFSSGTGRTSFNNTTNPNCFFADASLAALNISNVGVAGTTISFDVIVPLAAGFSADKTSVCPLQTVQFSDLSSGGPSGWTWSFSPSTVSFVNGTNSNSQHPHVQFNASGNYSVTLNITGPGGSDSRTLTNYITVLSEVNPPFTDDFESNSFSTNNWTVENPDNSLTWTIKSSVGGNSPGSKSPYVRFYSYASRGQYDYLITPPVNIETYGSAQLTFKVAYRPYSTSYKDSLKVMIYSDCGETWMATPYVKTGTVLATGTATTSEFTPSSSSHWRTETIDLNAYCGEVIRAEFVAVNDYGNNLYIDDVNITGTQLIPDFTASKVNPCVAEQISFTNLSSGGATSWLWDFGDGNTSTLQHPVHTYTTAGNYHVTLQIFKGNASNSVTKNNYITVIPLNPVEISISAQPPGVICQGESVTFSATPTNPGQSPVYQWKVNSLNAGTNSSAFTYTPQDGDQVQCILTSSLSCTSNNPASSNTITAEVTTALIVAVSIEATPAGVICTGESVTYNATPTNPGLSPVYQWKVNGLDVGTNSS